jgi:serine phosphatase RsbU (regulator of sigma subunit)
VTCWLATYEPGSRTLRAANAGHPPAVLCRAGVAQRVTGYTVPPLGTRAVPEVTEHVVRLESGDLLILYTDGLVERRGEDLDHGIARLERIAAVVGGANDPALALVDELALDAADDVCVVTLRVD